MQYKFFQKQVHQAEVVTNKTGEEKVAQPYQLTKDRSWRRYGYRVCGKPIAKVNQHGAD